MNKIIELLQLLTESPIGMFSTVFGLLLIGTWLIIRFTRKVSRLDLSQKHLEEGQKEIVKKIDQLSTDMYEGFRKVDERFEKMDERFNKLEQKMDGRFVKVDDRFEKMDKKFDRKIESLSEKLDRNTEELRKDIANLRTDVRILQHDSHPTNVTVLKTKRYRPSNKRKMVSSF